MDVSPVYCTHLHGFPPSLKKGGLKRLQKRTIELFGLWPKFNVKFFFFSVITNNYCYFFNTMFKCDK